MRLLAFAAAFAVAFFAAPAHAQVAAPIAMVSDVQGGVRAVRGRDSTPVKLLAEIAAGARLEVDAGAFVVLLVLASGDEVTVRGPATAQVAATAIVATPASALTRKTSGVGDVKLKRKDLVQAAIVMRKTDQTVRLPLLTLAGTLTTEARPVFRWSTVAGSGPYRFVLADDAGRILHEARTEADRLALPDSVRLDEGRVYSWEVSTRLANGLEYSNFGDFALAGAKLRADAARARPRDGSPFADWVAYAVWLDTVELSDAAREVWGRLARERPGEAALERMAGP